jgi:ABC-2 type transport system ATP-binding protein
MISVQGLTKEFKMYASKPGLLGSLSTLFSRKYETVRAIEDLSFQIPAGTKLACLGPNGAGKSTTIKILTGIMTPTTGECRVCDLVPYRDRKRNARNIGVVFGQRTQLWWDLPVIDSFTILQRIYDIPEPIFKRNMHLFDELLNLSEICRVPVRKLSLGQRMRAEIAASFVHDPKVVFLDEPTIGLDAILKTAMRKLINRMNRELGTTVVLTSHDINDVTAVCDDVLILHKSTIVFHGPLEKLAEARMLRTIVLDYCGPRCSAGLLRQLETTIPGIVAIKEKDTNRLSIEFDKSVAHMSHLMSALLEKFDIIDFTLSEPDIENILKQIYVSGGFVKAAT